MPVPIPGEIFMKILQMLEGSSLHRARQVCHYWNNTIMEKILGTVEGRRRMMRRMWRLASPSISNFEHTFVWENAQCPSQNSDHH